MFARPLESRATEEALISNRSRPKTMTEDSAIGREIDGYRIKEIIGRGGMGIVYRGEDIELARPVAIKRLDPTVARNRTFFLRRFRSEARMLARLDSSYIARVYTLRQTELGLLIIMEYVEGGTLAAKLADGPLEIPKALTLFNRMLRAFQDAHSAGVLHRDIKPENILLTPREIVKVTDFGLARLQQEGTQASFIPEGAGTLNYMSPEQVQGEGDLDERSDIYALGMTFYEMLTGRLPFEEDQSQFARMQSIVEDDLPPPGTFRPEVPAGLSRIVMKALEKEPEQRFQKVETMREAVRDFEAGYGTGTEEQDEAAARRATQPASAPITRIGGVLLLLFLLAGSGYYFLARGGESPTPAAATLSIATAPAGATVSLNGDAVKQTPLRNHAVEAGSLAVQIRKNGYAPLDTTLHLASGRNARLDLSLARQATRAADSSASAGGAAPPRDGASETQDDESLADEVAPDENAPEPETTTSASATLTLRSEPSGTVSVGGERKSGGGTFEVAPGRHAARCRHPQYGPLEKTVALEAGQSRTLTCYFQQTINVNTDGAWGNIWINGENTGRSTPDAIQRGPGTYRIGVRIERTTDYTVAGGDHRTTTGGRSTTARFSGSTATVVVEPTFAPREHALVFKVVE